VSLDHFDNMGMRILKGRGFQTSDNRGKPRPVIVSESFARQFFPNADPIGQYFGQGGNGTVMQADDRIVGVINDSKYRGMREIPPPTIYTLLDEDSYFAGMVLHVRCTAMRLRQSGAWWRCCAASVRDWLRRMSRPWSRKSTRRCGRSGC
jgi:hypothetical protein